MRHPQANSSLLLRYADAAGYGAVSFTDDEPFQHRAKSRIGYWRAFLSFCLIIL